MGKIPADKRKEHKGFREWDFVSSRRDHQSIVQILIDGRDPNAIDIEEKPLPTLIRVSSSISNAPLILTVDCDMYSNNSEAIKDAICFFLDEEKGHEIAYVQYPQCFHNVTKNDIYGNSLRVIMEVEFAGFDGNGGPAHTGTGCFHRREILCGMKHNKELKVECRAMKNERTIKESASVLEANCKALASCTYEENTQWGKELKFLALSVPYPDKSLRFH
ncbi:hypothetical protein DITRI_Ditri06bG0129400 [Diplodiscus trichospermus]